MNEMYPPEVKDAASGIITMLSWGFNLLISLTFLIMITKMGLPATYFFFTAVGVVGVVFFIFLLPETKSLVH